MAVCNAIENCFVAPSNLGNEVVILTDIDMNYGVMNINSDTLAISSDTVKLLNEAFFVNYPSKVADLNPTGSSVINNLLESLSCNRIIALLSEPPMIDTSTNYNVSAGDVINNNPVSGENSENPVIAEYDGNVICVKICCIRLYIYFSCESLLDIACNPTIEGYNCILDFGSFGTTIIPEPAKTALGANCSACNMCGACRTCAACALCGEVNYGVASIALVAVDAALSVTGAISSFAVNRP